MSRLTADGSDEGVDNVDGRCAALQFLNSMASYSNVYRRLVATSRRPQKLLESRPDIPLLTMRWD